MMLCVRVSRCVPPRLHVAPSAAHLRAMATYRKIKPAKILGRKTMRERIMSPTADGDIFLAVNVQRHLIVAASSVAGIGALCLTGSKLSKKTNEEDHGVWPNIVRARVSSTYQHLMSGACVAAGAAALCTQSTAFTRLLAANRYVAVLGTISSVLLTGTITLDLAADRHVFGVKHAVWGAHCAALGSVLATIGGATVFRSAAIVAAMIVGLSSLAVCAPSEKFLNVGGPLAMGLGTVSALSLAPWFGRPVKLVSPPMYPVYGVCLLMGVLLLFNMQHIVRRAETHPFYSKHPYDPVNNAMLISLDVANVIRKENK